MTTYVALLRGINVGGHRPVPMPVLRDAVTAAGYDDVSTYIQSGNVVCSGPRRGAARVAAEIAAAVHAAVGFEVDVVARTAAEWRAVIAGQPFPVDEPKAAHVAFLPGPPPGDAFTGLERAAFAPQDWAVGTAEVYLYLPAGIGRSKLAETIGRRLGGAATLRNWNTVLALADLAGA